MNGNGNGRDGTVVLELTGSLTVAQRSCLLTALEAVLESPGIRRIELDCGRLERLDCAGIGRLVSVYCRARDNGTALRLTNVGPRIRELLELVQLDGILVAAPTQVDARPVPTMKSNRGDSAPRQRVRASVPVRVTR